MSQNRDSGGQAAEPRGSEQETWSTSDSGAEYGAGTATSASRARAAEISAMARDYGQSVANAASTAKEYVADKAAAMRGTLSDLELTEQVMSYTRRNPGPALLLSGAVGLLLSLILPARRRRSYGEPSFSIEAALARQKDVSYAQAIVTPQTDLMLAQEYIISKPIGLSDSEGLEAQFTGLNTTPGLRILDEGDDDDDKVVLLSEEELAQLKAKAPGLIIEPNIFYNFGVHALLEKFNTLLPPLKNRTVKVRVLDSIEKRPLSGVPVYLVTDTNSGRYSGYRGITDKNGICTMSVARSSYLFQMLIVDPEAGYWTRRLHGVAVNKAVTVELNPLPCNNSAVYDWGHQFAGMNDDLPQGEGVTIGIIDSGVADHPGLHVTEGLNCVRGENANHWQVDASGHGTHCAGVLAATIDSGRGVKGYVPRARIFAYKAVPKNAPGPRTDAVLKAIKAAMKQKCDIISMSFGSSQPGVHFALSKQLIKAYEKGVFCVAAAGNEARDVNYPAAFQWVMGVGAFGRLGAYPADSLHAEFESQHISTDGNYYLAKFSNWGPNIDFCAPGIAVVSTVPGGGYIAKDGTSMACPQVAGIAALALAAHPEIMQAKRNDARVNHLVHILKDHSEPLGFGPRYEGAGGLKITRILGANGPVGSAAGR